MVGLFVHVLVSHDCYQLMDNNILNMHICIIFWISFLNSDIISITSIVNKWLDSVRKERNEGTNQKSNKQTKAIVNLTNENEVLRELIVGERQQLMKLRNR
jgi:hypothetical protein